MAVPLIDVKAHRAIIGDEIDAKIAGVIDHGHWIMGPEVSELESELGAFIGEGVQAVSCANGTDALTLAMTSLGLKPGQAVICPTFTFAATAECIVTLGGRPVFADVSELDFNLTPGTTRAALESAQSEGLNVVGVVAVDLFGQPADYQSLRRICDEHSLWLVADAAQSFGASSQGKQVGSLADVTTTSFFPAKPLGCYGDGGAVFTADEQIADLIRSLRVHGKGGHKYDNVRAGYNSRLDTIQAAVLLPKLAILQSEVARRQAIADVYNAAFKDLDIITPVVQDGIQSAWAQYTIRTPDRDRLMSALSEQGVGSAVYYPIPLHQSTAYSRYGCRDVDLSVACRLAGEVMSLPMYPYLSPQMMDEVISSVSLVKR